MERKILYIRAIAKKDKYDYLKTGLAKTTGRINDDLGYRHWDEWVDNVPQPLLLTSMGRNFQTISTY